MGTKGGARPGSGRIKGSKNKATMKRAEVAAMALDSGITPLEYMLDIMRAPIPDDVDTEARALLTGYRFEAAKAAAPYVHPRLAAVEHTGKDGSPLTPVLNVTISKS